MGSLRWIARAVMLCSAVASASSSVVDSRQLAGSNSACGKERVRKSWTQLGQDEKDLYFAALETAMTTREFFEFSKIHMDAMSEKQAHSTCAFLIWHKRYLLAFENMLRSQGTKFACVTVPYWDVMKEYAALVDGKCTDIYSCSAIVRDLGGSVDSTELSRTMSGRTVSDPCYASFAGKSYCDDNGDCGCLPRGDLTQALPSSCGYTGLFNQIAYSASFEEFTMAIQRGIHNEVHSSLGGFMGTYTAPIDPLFWSWHATVDMMLFVYHRCHVSSSMSDMDIRKSVYGFTQDGECRYTSDAPTVNVNGQIVQQSETNGVMYTAAKNQLIGKYFSDLPDGIADYISYHSDGELGYKYEIPEAFNTQLLRSPELCRTSWEEWKTSANTPSTPPSATAAPASSASADSSATVKPSTTPSPTATPDATKSASPASSRTPKPSLSTIPATSPDTIKPVTPGSSTTPKPSKSALPKDSYSFSDGGDGKADAGTVKPESSSESGKKGSDPSDPKQNNNANAEAASSQTGSLDDEAVSVDDIIPSAKPKPSDIKVNSTAPRSPSPSGAGSAIQKSDDSDKPGRGTGSRQSDFLIGVGTPEWADSSANLGEKNATGGVVDVVLSDGDLNIADSKYWTWYDKSREELAKVFPGNITEIARQMEYVGCVTFGAEYEIRNFTKEFMAEFRLDEHRPNCQKRVEEVKEGKCGIALEAKSFAVEGIKVRPGVTPAPAVAPEEAFKEYEQRVNTESGYAGPATSGVSPAVSIHGGAASVLMMLGAFVGSTAGML